MTDVVMPQMGESIVEGTLTKWLKKAGEPVDPHAGILFHARRGAKVERGEPLATVYATRPELLAEPVAILKRAIDFSKTVPNAVPLVGRVFTRENAEAHLKAASSS